MADDDNGQNTADYLSRLFGLHGRVAVVTGGTGVLGSVMAHGLARAGVKVAILGRRRERAEEVAAAIDAAGGAALAVPADVLDKAALEGARDTVLAAWGHVDILVNAAGGNTPAATTSDEVAFSDLPAEALRQVVDLNLLGTLLPSQVFGAAMMRGRPDPESQRDRGRQGADGCIVNISSLAAGRALTRVVGYGAAKAAVDNATRWLAVELARSHGQGLRVNAIAPGFFVAEQNRRLLLEDDGSPTPRGQSIIAHTPAGRFGEPGELVATLLWLCGPGASFITGVVVPIDGGFGAFSGV